MKVLEFAKTYPSPSFLQHQRVTAKRRRFERRQTLFQPDYTGMFVSVCAWAGGFFLIGLCCGIGWKIGTWLAR